LLELELSLEETNYS